MSLTFDAKKLFLLQLFDKSDSLPKQSPDLLSFTITGLKDIANKHGAASTQTNDAKTLISDFVDQVRTILCYSVVDITANSEISNFS